MVYPDEQSTRLADGAVVAKVAPDGGRMMQRMSARDAKNAFGRLIDMARAEPVAIEKHGRPVVVVVALEKYEELIADKMTDHALSGVNETSEGEA